MKKILLILLTVVLLFGCIGGPSAPSNGTPQINLTNVTQAINETVTTVTQGCSPSYSVTPPNSAKLSSSGTLAVTAKCASKKTVKVLLNGAEVGSTTVPEGDSAVLNFNLISSPDGENSLEVTADGSQVFSGKWDISPLGYSSTAGSDNDMISIGRWKAVAFEVSNPVAVKKAGAYLMRLTSMTYGSNMVVDIRSDSSGKPGDVVATSSLPINASTLTPNWVYFPIATQLQKGRYWLVLRDDGKDEYNIRYITVDKLKPGNPNHMKMDLTKNEDTGVWSETQWTPLAYDRDYSFVISARD